MKIKEAQKAFEQNHGRKIGQKELACMVIPGEQKEITKRLWLSRWNNGKELHRVDYNILKNLVKTTGASITTLLGTPIFQYPCCTARKVMAMRSIMIESDGVGFVTALEKVCREEHLNPDFILDNSELETMCKCKCKTT